MFVSDRDRSSLTATYMSGQITTDIDTDIIYYKFLDSEVNLPFNVMLNMRLK